MEGKNANHLTKVTVEGISYYSLCPITWYIIHYDFTQFRSMYRSILSLANPSLFFVYIRPFRIPIPFSTIQIEKALMVCLGFEPGAAGS